jgi:hypothetical protein
MNTRSLALTTGAVLAATLTLSVRLARWRRPTGLRAERRADLFTAAGAPIENGTIGTACNGVIEEIGASVTVPAMRSSTTPA